ncbi:glycine cleavage system H protein [Spinellus fusiger]|nr:glycine cleavage system H protein [Spinellus fusiger]
MSLRTFATRVIRPFGPIGQINAMRMYATKYYTREHEWVSVENGIGKVGITDYAQHALGEVVFAELPQVGSTVEQDGLLGSVESVKASSDVHSPVSGEVIATNIELDGSPDLINSSPEEDGWYATIKLSNPDEVNSLFNKSSYDEFCSENSE